MLKGTWTDLVHAARSLATARASPPSASCPVGMILFDVPKLTTPGVALGLLLAATLIRLNAENMGLALRDVEPLANVAGAEIAMLTAVLASLAPARRAASVVTMVAMLSE